MAGLMDVPGLGGFLQGQQHIRQQDSANLQNQVGLMGILKALEAQKQEQADRADQMQIRQTVQQAAGDPAKIIERLMASGHPKAIELAVKMRGAFAKPEGQSIGSGGLRLPDGTVVPPTARPDTEGTWSDPYNLGGAMVQKNSKTGQIRTAVSREPQTKIEIPPPVTAVTVQDPNDPTGTIIIDGRTGKQLGKGPKMTEAGKIDAKTQLTMTGLGADLQSAEDLLTGVTRTSDGQVVKGNLPTGSGAGSLYDKAAGFFGLSPSGAAEADSLKTVAARLVSRVPRFEGPQSDKDVALYKQAAGDAGNDSLPRGRRLAALKTMRSIYAGYESGQRGRLVGNRRAADQGGAQPKVIDFNSLPE